MPVYIWTAKDPTGRPVVKEIERDSIGDSKAALIAEGFIELNLVSDDVMAATHEGFSEKWTLFGEEVKVTAAERVKHMGKPGATWLGVLGQGLTQSKGLLLIALAVASYQAYRGHPISAILAIFGLVCWIAFIVCVGLPSIYYNKLHKAAEIFRRKSRLTPNGWSRSFRPVRGAIPWRQFRSPEACGSFYSVSCVPSVVKTLVCPTWFKNCGVFTTRCVAPTDSRLDRRLATGESTAWPIANRRHSRLPTCAT